MKKRETGVKWKCRKIKLKENLSDEKLLKKLDLQLEKTFGMYQEYLDLLEAVFGCCSIPGKLDHALWVYGHSRKKNDSKDS